MYITIHNHWVYDKHAALCCFLATAWLLFRLTQAEPGVVSEEVVIASYNSLVASFVTLLSVNY